jgi:hypothetical protein
MIFLHSAKVPPVSFSSNTTVETPQFMHAVGLRATNMNSGIPAAEDRVILIQAGVEITAHVQRQLAH